MQRYINNLGKYNVTLAHFHLASNPYKLIKKGINMVKNRIYSIFKQNLKPYNRSYIFGELRYDMDKCNLDEGYKFQIEVLFDILDRYEKKKEEIRNKILLEGESFMNDIALLVSIRGISVFTAIGLISEYATIQRFKNAKKFCKYLRSTPRTEISNNRVKQGKTQKNGRKLAMELMLQAVNHFIRENSHFSRFYRKIQRKKGTCKARVAVIRKLLVVIFYMLKKREYYRYMDKRLHDKKIKEYRRFLEKD